MKPPASVLCGIVAMLASPDHSTDISGLAENVPHVWHGNGYGHDATHWQNNLWLFVQRIFK